MVLVMSCFTVINSFADDPAPPPPPGGHGYGGDQGPVGAPIDGGLGILLAMGAAYGGKKFLDHRKTLKSASVEKEKTQECQNP